MEQKDLTLRGVEPGSVNPEASMLSTWPSLTD